MPRKANPDKVSRANLVTRTVEFHTFKVKILPNGAETVIYKEENGVGAVDAARRAVMRKCKAEGTVIDIQHVSTKSGLYGMTYEKFIENAELLEEVKKSESEAE